MYPSSAFLERMYRVDKISIVLLSLFRYQLETGAFDAEILPCNKNLRPCSESSFRGVGNYSHDFRSVYWVFRSACLLVLARCGERSKPKALRRRSPDFLLGASFILLYQAEQDSHTSPIISTFGLIIPLLFAASSARSLAKRSPDFSPKDFSWCFGA